MQVVLGRLSGAGTCLGGPRPGWDLIPAVVAAALEDGAGASSLPSGDDVQTRGRLTDDETAPVLVSLPDDLSLLEAPLALRFPSA